MPYITVAPNVGVSTVTPQVAWDGSNWFVTYESGYNPATQTYLTGLDVHLTRVSPAGAVSPLAASRARTVPPRRKYGA